MIFKKDNFVLGCVLGFIAPLVGIMLLRMYKFRVFSLKETWQYLILEPGFKTLSVSLSLSLLLNALLFTIYLNTEKDKTAKGIFASTVAYAFVVLIIKTFF